MPEGLLGLDRALLEAVLALPHPDWLTSVMAAASLAGIGGTIWFAVTALLLVARQIRWSDAGRVVAALALAHVVVNLGLKPWIDRPRPPVAEPRLRVSVDVPATPSFPSGHAANAMAAALVLARAWRGSRGTRAALWMAAGLGAIARVYLGLHYPLDALAGCVTGLACGWMALLVPRFRAAP